MKLRPQAACPAPQGFATHEEQVKFMKMSNELSSEEKYDRDFSEMRNIEMMWWKIHSRAQTNEGLKDLLDRAIVYYRLLEETDTGGNDGAGVHSSPGDVGRTCGRSGLRGDLLS
jgi:hypothetical protein